MTILAVPEAVRKLEKVGPVASLNILTYCASCSSPLLEFSILAFFLSCVWVTGSGICTARVDVEVDEVEEVIDDTEGKHCNKPLASVEGTWLMMALVARP